MVAVVRPDGEGVKARVQEHTSDTSSRDKSAHHNDRKQLCHSTITCTLTL